MLVAYTNITWQWRWDGEGRLESKLGGLALDVEGANTAPGAHVWMFSKNATAAQ